MAKKPKKKKPLQAAKIGNLNAVKPDELKVRRYSISLTPEDDQLVAAIAKKQGLTGLVKVLRYALRVAAN